MPNYIYIYIYILLIRDIDMHTKISRAGKRKVISDQTPDSSDHPHFKQCLQDFLPNEQTRNR
jgi:hypothetical protein